MMFQLKKSKLLTIFFILTTNILLLFLIQNLESHLKLQKPEIINKEDILDNISFYAIFFIIIAPLFEEFIFRYPIRQSKARIISLVLCVLAILIFTLTLIKIMLCVYFLMVLYVIIYKKKFSNLMIVFSIILFVGTHLGNYDYDQILSSTSLEMIFLFIPQLILGVVVTGVRIKYSFLYSLTYHAIYNASILILAINFD